MKLLFVIDNLGSGGAQRQMVTLAVGLTQRGHQVEIFTYHDADHFTHAARRAGVTLHLHPKPSRFSIRPILALRALISNGRYDGVLAFLETPSLYAEIANVGRATPPLIVSERSSYSRATLGWQGWLKQWMHRSSDAITVNSYHQCKNMIQIFPWMAKLISVIWNGVDLDHFDARPLPEPKDGELRVQVLASLTRAKNPLSLAKAIARCRDHYGLLVNVNWAGVTKDSEGGAVRNETDAFLQAAKLTAQWSWAGEVKDVRPFLADCDVVIHPSVLEGLPNSLCEALSCGRPILAGDIGDHARLVDGGANGLLFNPEDSDDIANTLSRYARLNGDERRQMAESARNFAERKLSIQQFVEAYELRFAVLSDETKKAYVDRF